MNSELFLSLIEILLAAIDVINNVPNDNLHIKKLKETINKYKIEHQDRARNILELLAKRD